VKNQSGFTLVEALIGLSLTGLILGIMFSGFAVYFKMYSSTEISLQLQQELRKTFTMLERDIKNAAGVAKYSDTILHLIYNQDGTDFKNSKFCNYFIYPDPGVDSEQSVYELRRLNSFNANEKNAKGIVVAQHVCPPPDTQIKCEVDSIGHWVIKPKIALCKRGITVSAQGCFSVRN